MTKNAISWFEIPVTDFERAKAFYSQIFDYEMTDMEMGPYKMGFLPADMENGGVGGAIIQGEGCEPSQVGARIYLNGGDDLMPVLNRVEVAGGKIILPKTEISPEFGCYATFADTEGNHIYLHSPS
ncbi:MAG: VOC family protein [Cyclobacteriaceae bacterium]